MSSLGRSATHNDRLTIPDTLSPTQRPPVPTSNHTLQMAFPPPPHPSHSSLPGEYLMYSDATRPLYQAPLHHLQPAHPIHPDPRGQPQPQSQAQSTHNHPHPSAATQPNHYLHQSHAVSLSPRSPHQQNLHEQHQHQHQNQQHQIQNQNQNQYHMYGTDGTMPPPPPSGVGGIMNNSYGGVGPGAGPGVGTGGPVGMVQPGIMQHQRPSHYLPQIQNQTQSQNPNQNQMRNRQQTPPMNSIYPQPPSAFTAPPSVTQSYYSQPPSVNFNPAYQPPFIASPSPQSQMTSMQMPSTSQPQLPPPPPPPPPPTFSAPQPQSASPRPPPQMQTQQQPTPQQLAQLQAQGTPRKPSVQPPQKPILQPPLSPESAKLETQRVSALLEINRMLIQEVVHLQSLGRAGAPNPQDLAQQQYLLQKQGQATGQASPSKIEGETDAKKEQEDKKDTKDTSGDADAAKPKIINSQEYIHCMRRLQSNLAYLASISERLYKPPGTIPICPALMDSVPPAPDNAISEEVMIALRKEYEHLRSLFPEVSERQIAFNTMKAASVAANGGQGAGGQGVRGPMSNAGPGGTASAVKV